LISGGSRILDGDLLAEDGGDLPHLYICISLFWQRGSTAPDGFQGRMREDVVGSSSRLLDGDPLVEDGDLPH
jgi:hypothetical protein